MKKALVAFFSASGVTKQLAQRLAASVGADLFEIEPAVPYTKADLNWMDKKSRSTLEMKDTASRPAIAKRFDAMAEYDVVFVGFPIWWYREPSIIDTFMEAYDFDGKTIVPFATSGGSGMGESSDIMQALAPNASVVQGRRFPARAGEAELREWASEWLR